MLRRLMAEWLGTFSLLATVVGSGIMAERLAGGNVAIALLGNTIPTGAILIVLILVFGPISGAQFQSCCHTVICYSKGYFGPGIIPLRRHSGDWRHMWCVGRPCHVRQSIDRSLNHRANRPGAMGG